MNKMYFISMTILLMITMGIGVYSANHNFGFNALIMGIFSGKIGTHIILKYRNRKIQLQSNQ